MEPKPIKQFLSITGDQQSYHIAAEITSEPVSIPVPPFGVKYSDRELTAPMSSTNNFQSITPEPHLIDNARVSYSVHCRHCNCPSIVHTPFPTVTPVTLTTSKAKVMFCPVHGKITLVTKTDAYDSYAVSLSTPRTQTIEFMLQSKAIMTQATVKFVKHRKPTIEQSKYSVKSSPLDAIENIDWLESIMQNVPNHGVTNVHIACKSCSSLSSITLSNRLAPLGVKFCPHCGESNIIVTQSEPSHELAFTKLAEQYNIHPWYAESLYTLWATSYTQYPTFQSFMLDLPSRMAKSPLVSKPD